MWILRGLPVAYTLILTAFPVSDLVRCTERNRSAWIRDGLTARTSLTGAREYAEANRCHRGGDATIARLHQAGETRQPRCVAMAEAYRASSTVVPMMPKVTF